MSQNPLAEEWLPTIELMKNPALAEFIAETWKSASTPVAKVQAGIKKSEAQ